MKHASVHIKETLHKELAFVQKPKFATNAEDFSKFLLMCKF